MTDAIILTLCVTVFLLCGLFEVLVKLDQRSRRERLADKQDALRNRAP